MVMPTAIVMCVATPDYVDQWAFCIDSQREYSTRHGFEYVLQTRQAGGLNAKWSKLHYALAAVSTGHDMLLIDADAEITPSAPPFTRELAQHHHADVLYVLGISKRPNSGVLILRSQSAAPFLSECLERRTKTVPPDDFVTSDGENGHVISIIKKAPFAQRSQALPLQWNCTRPELAHSAYIRHYTNFLRDALLLSRRDHANGSGQKHGAT